jgi:hypothetical protein
MASSTAETWRSFSWLCFGAAIFNLILIFFLSPESNFDRPELDLPVDQLTTFQHQQASKEAEQVTSEERLEDVPEAPSTPGEYTISTPSMREIMQPVSYNANVNLLKAFIKPLNLLVHPSVLWGILSYAVTLSPQVILM